MKRDKGAERRVRRVDASGQLPLTLECPADVRAQGAERCSSSALKFSEPDPNQIQIGLKDHLINTDSHEVFLIDQVLSAMDWSDFEASYKPGGRPPYSPRLMVGMILYGVFKGRSSLRELEEMARRDLGCMWLSGGLMPDHSAIGHFIQRHSHLLLKEFFISLTHQILKRTGTHVKFTAGDATVIEGAGSRFATVKREALERRTKRAQQEHDELESSGQSDSKKGRAVKKKLDELHEADKRLREREEARKAKGKDPARTQINLREPDAVNQPLKQQGYGTAYKPAVIANDARIIVGHGVHASSETLLGGALLAQASGFGALEESSWDAGYSSQVMFVQEALHGVSLLIPEGRTHSTDWNKSNRKQYPKSQFEYDAESNTYRCPAGQLLHAGYRNKGDENKNSRAYTVYKTEACQSCEQRDQCTKSKTGRSIKRFDVDELREAMRKKFDDESTRERYRKRAAWVEPVFSEMRHKGLNRFRRKGLAGVSVEFSIHSMAHNLGRLIALCCQIKKALQSAFTMLQIATMALFWILIAKLQNSTVKNTRPQNAAYAA